MARRSSRRSRRRNEERRFETAIYGLIMILFVILMAYPILDAVWVSLIGGAILIGAAVYQSQRRWRTGIFTWLGGFLLMAVGILGFQTGSVPMGMLLPIGVLIVVVLGAIFNGDL